MSNIFGIDLGTTNSLIGLYKDNYLSELVPSVVRLTDGEAGKKALNDLSAVRSFKTDISMGHEGELSIKASSLVLKELKSIAEKEGYEVKDVVISVPAYFTTNQREATSEAAKKAGLNLLRLVNEPTAAAMYYCKDIRRLAVVFDLGGGTFDISVIDTRNGIYDVQETSGLVVGGDNLDREIFKEVVRTCNFKTHRSTPEDMQALMLSCTEAKLQMQKTGESQKISHPLLDEDFILTVEKYKLYIRKTFKLCLIKTFEILERGIAHNEDYDLIFVGGSTRCPYLKEWIETEIGKKSVPVSYNPDEIVSLGASYYASLLENGTLESILNDITKPIGIGLKDGTMKIIIPKNSKIPVSDTLMVTNPETAKGLELNFYQGENLMVKKNQFIGAMKYDFGETVVREEAQVCVSVRVDTSGRITLSAKEFGRTSQEIILKM